MQVRPRRASRWSIGVIVALSVISASSRAGAYCREVTEGAPAGYDPVSRGCFVGSADGGPSPPLFWRNQCVSYSVQRDGSKQLSLADIERVAGQAFITWGSAQCPGGGTPGIVASAYPVVDCQQVPSQGHNNAIIFRDGSWPYDDIANAIGYTTLTVYEESTGGHVAGEIIGADIEINSANYTIVASATPPAGAYDLSSILTHEVGHFLGLAHSTETSAVMYALYHPQSTTLTLDDISGICSIYPPDGSRTTTIGAVAATACQPEPPLGFLVECGTLDAGQVTEQFTTTVACSDSLTGCSISGVPSSHRQSLGGCVALTLLGAAVGRRRTRRGGMCPAVSRARTCLVGVLFVVLSPDAAEATVSIAASLDKLAARSSAAAVVQPIEQRSTWDGAKGQYPVGERDGQSGLSPSSHMRAVLPGGAGSPHSHES
jgi:matrixin